MKKDNSCSAVTGYAFRIALGGLLLIAGVAKFSGGVETFVTNSVGMLEGTIMPMGVAKAYLTVVPLLEVVVGGLIILGLFMRHAALVAAFMFALFVVGLAATGDPNNYVGMANNFLFLFASTWLSKLPGGPLSLDHYVNK